MVEALCLEAPVGPLRIVAPHGYHLDDAMWHEDAVLARVTPRADAQHCSNCGSANVRRYGRGDVGIRDAPAGGVQARLLVSRQRIECETCERLSREPLPGVSEGHRYTDRCANWMVSQFPFRSNLAIASTIGLDEKSVRVFAAEAGVVSRRGSPQLEANARCGSCLRLISESPEGTVRLDHASPRGQPAIVALCVSCNADRDARWIEQL